MQKGREQELDLDVVHVDVVGDVVDETGLEDLADEVDEAHLEELREARSGFLGSIQQAANLDKDLFQLQAVVGAGFEPGCKGLADGAERHQPVAVN